MAVRSCSAAAPRARRVPVYKPPPSGYRLPRNARPRTPGDLTVGLLNLLRFITDHPLSQGGRGKALGRFVRWQAASRLAPGPIVVDFVGGTKLVVRRGMTGATGNIYVGLHEFDDMAFVLHFLRPGDRMLDIGANIGSYSILAAAAGAQVCAFEPAPATFESLRTNVAINHLNAQVETRNAALGAETGVIRFTSTEDTTNHVATVGDAAGVVETPVTRLDDAVTAAPILIKLDVEGYETAVVEGGPRTLSDPTLQAVVMELNGSGARYGYGDDDLHRRMVAHGFSPYAYDGLRRLLTPKPPAAGKAEGNILYLRDAALAAERVRGAPRFAVLGQYV